MNEKMKNQIVNDSISNKRLITCTLRSIVKLFITEQKKQDANNTDL